MKIVKVDHSGRFLVPVPILPVAFARQGCDLQCCPRTLVVIKLRPRMKESHDVYEAPGSLFVPCQ